MIGQYDTMNQAEQFAPVKKLDLTKAARARHTSRGQSLVELALVLPFFMLLLGGIADFGHAFQSYISITNAVSEGGRVASRLPTDSAAIQQRVRNELYGTSVTITSITITYPNGASTSGNPVRVTVVCNITTIMGSFIGWDSILVSKTIDMIII